jgi:heterogeneous nuclear ribonucleoprotein F/H
MPGPPQAKRAGGGIQVGDHTGYLRMRGLPFSATKEDIASFFAIYNPVLDSVVLTYRSDGRATGEAYVGFETPDDSKRAMDLHRKSMGTRYIELFLSNKEEHGRALVRFGNR